MCRESRSSRLDRASVVGINGQQTFLSERFHQASINGRSFLARSAFPERSEACHLILCVGTSGAPDLERQKQISRPISLVGLWREGRISAF